jgi:hypothetical protein
MRPVWAWSVARASRTTAGYHRNHPGRQHSQAMVRPRQNMDRSLLQSARRNTSRCLETAWDARNGAGRGRRYIIYRAHIARSLTRGNDCTSRFWNGKAIRELQEFAHAAHSRRQGTSAHPVIHFASLVLRRLVFAIRTQDTRHQSLPCGLNVLGRGAMPLPLAVAAM